MDGPPVTAPIGLQLARSAKVVSRAFDDALVAAGGSLPVWLVLVTLKAERHGAQRHVAEAIGVEGPTLTHHLNKMEAAGLVIRSRDRTNRRVHQVDLTPAGEALFQRLLEAVTAFDRLLRQGLTPTQVKQLSDILRQLSSNAGRSDA